VHLRSDAERKRLMGVGDLVRLGPEAYRAEVSAMVYRRIGDKARRALRCGYTVIADATFLRREDRDAIRRIAEQVGARFTGLWLEVGQTDAQNRVTARKGDVSDATAEVVARQFLETSGPSDDEGWGRIDAGEGRAHALAIAQASFRDAKLGKRPEGKG
jgi:predicted kinase